MKLTKRKQFAFYRSYYDVFNELNDADKLKFIEALLDKEFRDVDPVNLKGMVKFAYISQMDSIEKQVKGYQDKTKVVLNPSKGSVSTPTQGGDLTPSLQEKEEEKEKEKYIYSYESFLKSWEKARTHYLKKPTHIKKLDFHEANNFKEISKDYTPEQIKQGIHGLFKQKNKNISSMYLKPKHFLENFVKYYNAEMCKEYELYGKGEQLKTEL